MGASMFVIVITVSFYLFTWCQKQDVLRCQQIFLCQGIIYVNSIISLWPVSVDKVTWVNFLITKIVPNKESNF